MDSCVDRDAAEVALALSCPSGHVVWVEAYNSSNGAYKQVYWQGWLSILPRVGHRLHQNQ